ncbi:pullulanase-type alpha-1,6-glucosidase [Xenorhabdus bovienii]|uniref:Pullulanase (Alpha-dextrin endo-1,6-alpha-glucosidase) (Pullulan 6-glucanohydrolase) n=3 Tax=Xenorhabdus bovienii TaxID=40576 RepID=A0A077NFQ8_XENBV|nr:pullulanase-type alpha-1,6-glucosidase [Xenorhabdus bovienii]CDG87717.1 Pullulanase precursor (Alpha-dextrin endo-1,6-alpha-glucosidase) (Pullulan 6-glucanohydrolase) [Xenorhabdus bovienii str. feltiae France]CDG91981.1 Pullulanase precursor (Alpha-dextrin endo-1,6-alpha-glucosidase) (Pullulan 6-glucanohydrolase) [Xenorhabdus bovienii str. feltiae Florida]CDG97227.1 Pullulanase precursor (Alpha-dextrin endo-1,6-alpha-glucosidase) (Pullulan 6-glucanohydrolase) [Xenorhabdus bovienii str. puntau
MESQFWKKAYLILLSSLFFLLLTSCDNKNNLPKITEEPMAYIPNNIPAKVTTADDLQASAHWVDKRTLLWPEGADKPHVRLYYNRHNKVEANDEGNFTDSYLALTPTTLSKKTAERFPHLAELPAFHLPENTDVDRLITGDLVALATNEEGLLLSATQVQIAGVLDDRFAGIAETLEYGALINDTEVTFRLWAPTAQNVGLVIYNEDKQAIANHTMNRDAESGSWSWQGDTNLIGAYYRYALTVYHPYSRKVERYEVTDPYSHSLSTNSEYSQVINLDDEALKPQNWDDLSMPHPQKTPADIARMTLYEAHIRDLSVADSTVPQAWRGKYLALTANSSDMFKHLKALSQAGMTHIELLPVFDIASINEFSHNVVDLNQPFNRLCQVNTTVKNSRFADYCNRSLTVREVLQALQRGDSASNPQVQELNEMIAETDSYNWGYDPFHYSVPEGSYATHAEGSVRIKEFRAMVQAIKQQLGMNVIMDVAYNHTNAAGPAHRTSVLDKVVPWYYHRLDEITGNVENNTCCSDTAPEHRMFSKLIEDSLVTWVKHYKIDAFRFDLMGYHPKAQIVSALAKVRTINPSVYFFGEGWNSGQDDRFETASQINLKGSGIGTFSDRLRDSVRGGGPFDSADNIRINQGMGNGAGTLPNEIAVLDANEARHLADLVRLGMAGNLADFVMIDKDGKVKAGREINYKGVAAGYAADPIEVINYVSKHDNQTLWDIISYKAAYQADLATRLRMQAISLSTVLLGQGLAFDQQGSELLRSKSFTRDSYNAGDWFNRVSYNYKDNNYDVGMPGKRDDGDNYALIHRVKNQVKKPGQSELLQMMVFYQELLRLRQFSPLMTLGKGESVKQRIDFRNVGPHQQLGLLVMTIDDGNTTDDDRDLRFDGLVVVINAASKPVTVRDLNTHGLKLNDIQSRLGNASLAAGIKITEDGMVTMPAWSAAVLVLPQKGIRGTGLPVRRK